MADRTPLTPTEDIYNRGVENFRNTKEERRDLPNRGYSPRRSMQDRRSTSRSPKRRSRSPIRRRSRTPPRRDRYDNSNRGLRGNRPVRNKDCRVYVSNLSYEAKWMELKDVMKRVAHVEHVEVFTDGQGRSKGCGVVEYESSEDAKAAVKELDGYELLGRKLRLREDNVDDETYKEQLKTQKDKTKQLKEKEHSHMFNDPGIGGLGNLGGLGGLGALLGVQTAQTQLVTMLNAKGGDPLNSSVFVSNVDYDITWQKLKDMFRRAGCCIRCEIATDHTNRSKGFGSVQFETPMEALTSIALFNGMELGNARRQMIVRMDRNAPLNIALAQVGINSKEITQQTIVQLHSLATVAALGSSGLGAGLGNLGALGGLGALTGLGALGNTNALSNLQSSQTNSSAPGLNLTGLAGLGSLSQLSALLGGNAGLNNSAAQGMGAGVSSVGSVGPGLGNSYGFGGPTPGLSNLNSSTQMSSSFGSGGQSDRRSMSGNSRGYSSTSNNPANMSRVFVRNLPFSTTWQQLKDKFRDAGHVTRADVKTNDDGRSKGYAVVTFETPGDANKAVSLFNGCRMEGREIEVRLDRS